MGSLKKQLKSLWRNAPGMVLLLAAAGALTMICNTADVFLLESAVDNLAAPDAEFRAALPAILLLCGIYAWSYLREPLVQAWKTKGKLALQRNWESRLMEKISRIATAKLELEETQLLISYAKNQPAQQVMDGFCLLLDLIFGALNTVFVLTIILRSAPAYILGVILLLLVMTAVFAKIGAIRAEVMGSRQKLNQRAWYLSSIPFDRPVAMERKLFDCADMIHGEYRREVASVNGLLKKRIFTMNATTGIYQWMCALFSLSAYLFLLSPLQSGTISIGLYIALIPALKRIGDFCVAALTQQLSGLKEKALLCQKLDELESLPEQSYNEGETAPSRFQTVVFEDVGFSYPNSEKEVFSHLSFSLDAAKTYALVGRNGCGKSTLVKLLLGLYPPSSGRILIDGKDNREISFAEIQSKMSVLFQDFGRYDLTVEENIALSNKNVPEQLEKALADSGFGIVCDKLEKGTATELGAQYRPGMDLSGGQWQKLAIARTLYRNRAFLILDEPTAALDPLAESELYADFLRQMQKNRGCLLVTHRLAAATLTDQILVLEEGRVLEQGTHQELMEKAGRYAEFYQGQQALYVNAAS